MMARWQVWKDYGGVLWAWDGSWPCRWMARLHARLVGGEVRDAFREEERNV